MVNIEYCIHNSLPINEVSFGFVICSMDDRDIERAEKQKYLVHNMNDYHICIIRITYPYLVIYKLT